MNRYLLLRPSEDGNPVWLLNPGELSDLLAHPSDWGVAEFAELSQLPPDPNYWPDKVGVLLRFEGVLPVPAGTFRLPDDAPPPDPTGGWVKFPTVTTGEDLPK